MNGRVRVVTLLLGAAGIASMLLLLGVADAAVSPGDTLTKATLQRLYIDYLTSEGYRPTLDSDGDVTFKRQGGSYFIGVAADDLNFFRVVFPNFWPIESAAERSKVLVAADFSNAKSKVCKVYTTRNNVWAVIELYVASPADFEKVFPRAMSGLDNGVANFARKMRE